MTTPVSRAVPFRLGLPKGRMENGVLTLLADAGIRVRPSARGYRPDVTLPGAEAKLLKPQNIVEMLALGSRDVGFAGADWVAELEADVVELLAPGSIRYSSSRPLPSRCSRRAGSPLAALSSPPSTSGSPVAGST